MLQLYVPILFGNAIDEVVGAHAVDFDRMWYYLSRILVMVIVFLRFHLGHEHHQQPDDLPARYRISVPKRSVTSRSCRSAYLDQHSTGDIISRVIADTDILSDGLLLGFTQLFSGIVTIVGTLIFMFSKNVWITLMVICPDPVQLFRGQIHLQPRPYQMFRKQSETRGKQTALIDEMIGNQKVVQAFGYEEKASEQISRRSTRNLKKYSQQAVFYSSLTNPSTRFVNNIIYAGVASGRRLS